MSASRRRVHAVARREFFTTVRRKAFLFMLLGTPAYFALVTFLSARAGIQEAGQALKDLTVIGVVDSSGLYRRASAEFSTGLRRIPVRPGAAATGPPGEFRTRVRFFPDLPEAEGALRAGQLRQVLVVPSDYLESGRVRRYAAPGSPFTGVDRRAIGSWLARNLLSHRVEPGIAGRAALPIEEDVFFTLNRDGQFELKDERREIADFLLPMMVALLLGISIIIGGQYLLQGVAEEKESRILESLLCQVSSTELMAGKLFGLGAVGLVVVGSWVALGLAASAPALTTMPVRVAPGVLAAALAYFLLGYLFFGGIMLGIGAVTSNMREAQQFAVWFIFANFAPFLLITTILSRPDSPLPFWLSMFPPTAPTSMMLRLAAPWSAVPTWQLALSLGLLAAAGWLTLRGAARVFRIGLLMYGKTPSLPEILRWARA